MAASGIGSLTLLLGIGSVASGLQQRVAMAATAAAGRLMAAGTPKPRWAEELAEPVRARECVRLYDTEDVNSVLVATFDRAGRGHAFVVIVDEQDCGAAADIIFADASAVPDLLDQLREDGRSDGLDIQAQYLDPAELRWHVEHALDARAVHDGGLSADEWFDEEDEDDEDAAPPYPVLAVLVRARLADLPEARRPAGARERPHADLVGGEFVVPQFGRPAPAKLPPPIWRRLLVPADTSLASLHGVILAAFGWHGGHMHAFETPYGGFGMADRELGHRAESPVTLEQVAPREKDKIQYTYDFGDDWVHEIVVEKVLDRDPALAYPRCTGGRRAAPPDDCGGGWEYAELVEILTDPQHPEHEERLDWLGLADAKQFDPAAFDVDEVNQALAGLR